MHALFLQKSDNTYAWYVFIKCKYTINLNFFQQDMFCSGSYHLPKYNTLMIIVPWVIAQGPTLVFLKCRADLPLWSIVNHFSKGVIALPFVWDVEWLKNVWKRCIIPTDSWYRSLQVQETFFLQRRKQMVNFKMYFYPDMKYFNLKYNCI